MQAHPGAHTIEVEEAPIPMEDVTMLPTGPTMPGSNTAAPGLVLPGVQQAETTKEEGPQQPPSP